MKIPSHWSIQVLGEVCERAKKVKSKDMPPSKEFIYLDISGINNLDNQINGHKIYIWKNAPSRAQQIIKKNDILFSTVRTYLKNIALVTKQEYDNQICSSGFTVIRGNKGISEPKYLFYLTLYEGFLQPLNELQTGTSYPAVRDKDVFEQKIPLPPLPEQHTIVSKIEQLFSELDNGIANLKSAKGKLEIYRQAVLKKAFEGELTKVWRAKQNDSPTADELLEQIEEMREVHYQKRLEEWKKKVEEWEKNGKEKKKPQKPKNLKKYDEPEIELNIEIPNSWILQCIGNLSSGVEYGSSAKSKKEGETPVLRMGNIQRCRFDWNDLVYSDNEEEIKQYYLKKDDVLFNRTNSPELVGKSAIYKNERPAIFAGYLIRINQIKTLLLGDYLNYYLNSHPAKVYGNYVKTDGVNQSNINGQKLSNYPIPFCSLEEQHQIVKAIETRLSVCDKLAASIDESLEKAEALRQSILKKAFEGKLLTEAELEACRNEPDWEQAEKLLERIKENKLQES